MITEQITLDRLKTEYPTVFAANEAKFDQLAQKGDGCIKISHDGKWLQIEIKGK